MNRPVSHPRNETQDGSNTTTCTSQLGMNSLNRVLTVITGKHRVTDLVDNPRSSEIATKLGVSGTSGVSQDATSESTTKEPAQ